MLTTDVDLYMIYIHLINCRPLSRSIHFKYREKSDEMKILGGGE